MSIFKKIAGNIHYDISIVYEMRPRSTGNYHGYTGRNEHGDPHVHAHTEYGEYKVYIITGEIEPVKDAPSPNAYLRGKSGEFIEENREELLTMWKTQNFHIIKNKKKHKKGRK